MVNEAETTGEKQPRIVRARIDHFALYEITDGELETLQQGSPGSLYLNFSIFLLSVGCSFVLTLLTVAVQIKLFVIFFVIVTVTFVVGLFLLILWWKTRQSIVDVVKRIRSRMPPDNRR